MDEFDPVAELGLIPDKLFVCNSRGFLLKNDTSRDLCARYIRNGAHIYDVLSRYDELTAYVLGREEASAGSVMKWILPFLKAHGATDLSMYQYTKENMRLMPGAEEAIRYISKLMPTYITTGDIQQATMPVDEMMDAPLSSTFSSVGELDSFNFGRMESRKIREMATEISKLKIAKKKYELNVSTRIDPDDVTLLRTVDDILKNRLTGTSAMNLMESSVPVFSHKKAYRLLEIRRSTGIDLDGTFYIGSEHTDYQPMYLVRDCNGIAVSYNGSDFAVRGCNVAVMSNDSDIGAFLASVFFDKGYEHVMELVNNWDRKYLKQADVMDTHLRDHVLARHSRKLPEVVLVDRHNVDAVAEKSETYRKRILAR